MEQHMDTQEVKVIPSTNQLLGTLKKCNNINLEQFSPQPTATKWDSPSSLNFALASSKMFRTFWIAHAYNFPKVTSSSILLNGGIRSTSFKQSVRGSLHRKTTTTISNFFLTEEFWKQKQKQQKVLPYIGSFWNKPLPSTEHSILHRWKQKIFCCQFQNSIYSLQTNFCSFQLQKREKKKLSYLCKLIIHASPFSSILPVLINIFSFFLHPLALL